MSNTQVILTAIKTALSPGRIQTYEAATKAFGHDDPCVLALYAWNAEVSAAFLAPLHICEVVIRNAVSDVLDVVYGPRWPWDRNFVLSLPNPQQAPNIYNPRRDLQGVAAKQPTTGKVIPELKFVFWQQMFTRRHDIRLWNTHLTRVFPNHDRSKTIVALRKEIYANLEVIRIFRNRIAHHEPIFSRNLQEDLQRLVELVQQRCTLVASWMAANQGIARLLSQTPVFKGGKLWTPSHDEIAQLAYHLWCGRGRTIGSAETDWTSAERIMGLRDR